MGFVAPDTTCCELESYELFFVKTTRSAKVGIGKAEHYCATVHLCEITGMSINLKKCVIKPCKSVITAAVDTLMR